jgi:hypothetical protein
MAQQQTIGRGKVYLAEMPDVNTPGIDFRYVGNTTSFKFNSETTKLDHFSSDDAIRLKDRSVVLGVDYKTEMVTDNLDSDNVAMFFLNTKGSLVQGVVGSATEVIGPILNGRSYQLGVTSPATPSGLMGIDPTGFAVALNPASTGLVDGVDYIMDLTSGIIHFLEASTIAVDGVSIDVTYAVLGTTRDTIITGEDQINASLKFVADNPIGANRNWYLPKTLISPTGDYELKTGDEWGTITFDLEALKLDGYEIAYANGVPA